MTKITAGPSHASRYTVDGTAAGGPQLLAKVRRLVDDLSPDNADLLTAFHRVQHEYGYVPTETIPALAEKFGTTPAMLYGALDFYSEIRTAPPAETTVEWCSGPACLLKGSVRIRRVLEAVLGCEMDRNTDDGAFGLRLVQCDGTCHLAPLVRLEGKYIGPLTVSDTVRLARELKGEGAPVATLAEDTESAEEEGEARA